MFKKGDVVRCVGLHGGAGAEFIAGAHYIVEEDEIVGHNNVLIVGHHRVGGHHPRWSSLRFNLVMKAEEQAIIQPPKLVPLTIHNVRVGLKVICIEQGDNPALSGALNRLCEITYVDKSGYYIRLKEFVRGTYGIEKFVVAPGLDIPVVAAPKGVGDKVVCIEGYRPAGLVRDAEYTIKTLYPPMLKGEPLVMVEELPGKKFKQSRFNINPVPAPVVPQVAKEIQVGDLVYVIKKISDPEWTYWVQDMDALVNNGVSYRVTTIEDFCGDNRIYLDIPGGERFFLKASLSHYKDGGKGVVAPNVATPPVAPPKPPPEDIRSLLRAAKKRGGNMEHHITSFAYKPVGDKEPRMAINPACYAALRGAGPLKEFAVDTQCHVHLNKDHVEAQRLYLHYLFNDSPWASGFITKDVQEALDKGVLMNCNVPISQVVGAATALREGIEQRNRLPLFQEMMEAGYHGNVAYLVAASCKRVGQSFVADAPQNSNHVALHTNLDKDALISFFLHGWPDLGRKPANEIGNNYNLWDDLTAGKAKANGRYGEGQIPQSFANWFAATAKQSVTGEGWNRKSSIWTKGLYEFASILEALVTKPKEQK